MTCSEAKLKLEPCASGTLPAEEKIALEEHLATCEGCRLELELTRAVLGSPAFDGVEEPAPNNPEHAPVSADTPVVPNSFEPPTAAEIDAEISFADLSLDESPKPADPATPGPGAPEKEPVASAAAAGGKKGGDGDALWDFEPVDAHRDVGPPQGSLSFANEALTRKHEEEKKRKATMLRLALWGGGIFGGVLLLGISVWIALAFRQGNQNDDTQPSKGSNPAPAGVTQTPAPGAVPTPTPSADSSAAAPTGAATTPAPTPDATAPVAQATVPAPATAPDHVVQMPSTPDAQAPVTTKKPTPKPAAPKPAVKPAPKPAPRDTHADDDKDGTPGWSPSDLQPAPSATKPVPKTPDASPAPNATTPSVGQAENPPPVTPQPNPGGTPNPQTAPTPGASVPPPATAPTAPSQTAPAPSNPAPAPAGDATAPAPGVTKPIDRLHLATVTATENQDLVTLRKLKESWKTLLKSVAGPDRSRTKREMADCLWAIQELSSRVSDRKEALAAYRDYVLTAPAGGVDSRSLSRMRYLEESLGEDN